MTRLPFGSKRWWLFRLGADPHSRSKARPDPALHPYLDPRLGLPVDDCPTPEEDSRLQHRLKHGIKRDRVFLRIVRRRRSRSSQLNQKLNATQFRHRLWRRTLLALTLGATVSGITWVALFTNERVTLGGVPYPIVRKFWQDEVAKSAYLGGDSQLLHDRLSELEVEEDIKDYYRPKFDDEAELDRYIHQIMFDRTGYVGEAYDVDNYGRLYFAEYGSQ